MSRRRCKSRLGGIKVNPRRDQMPSIAFAAPLLPGKSMQDRESMSIVQGERRAAYEASRQRLGITREAGWLQQPPNGALPIVYVEAHDLEAAVAGLATSPGPSDPWSR